MKTRRSSIVRSPITRIETCDLNARMRFWSGNHLVRCGLAQVMLVKLIVICLVFIGLTSVVEANYSLDRPIVITQLPVGTVAKCEGSDSGRMLRADYGEGARLIAMQCKLNSTKRVLSEGFEKGWKENSCRKDRLGSYVG